MNIDLFPNLDFELSDKNPTTGSDTASIILAKINARTKYCGFNSGTKFFSVSGGK